MRLRHTLVNDDRILRVNDIGDLERLRDAEQDYLVEVRGQLFRSPFNEALEAVFRVMGMFGVELPEDRPARAQTGGGGRRRNRGQSQQRGAPAATEFGLDNEALQGLQLMKRIREDLAQSKVLDMIMIPSAIENLTMVISLAQEFLPDGSVDNLLSGDYSVLGKVTRVVEGDDDINPYQRTVFRLLDSDTLDAVFAGIQQEGVFTLPDHPSHIKAPALQLLPMAIYA
jgi:hypothetical protein